MQQGRHIVNFLTIQDTLNFSSSNKMDESDSVIYSIKAIKQIDDEEFEAVFEFDADSKEGLRYR